MPSSATSMPASVPKALAMGVRKAPRANQALASAFGAALAMSSETAVSRQMARATSVRAFMRISIRRTSAWPMMVFEPSAVRPCTRSLANSSAFW